MLKPNQPSHVGPQFNNCDAGRDMAGVIHNRNWEPRWDFNTQNVNGNNVNGVNHGGMHHSGGNQENHNNAPKFGAPYSPSVPEGPKQNNAERFTAAVRGLGIDESRIPDIVAWLRRLSKRDRTVCLINDEFLANKVAAAQAELWPDDNLTPLEAAVRNLGVDDSRLSEIVDLLSQLSDEDHARCLEDRAYLKQRVDDVLNMMDSDDETSTCDQTPPPVPAKDRR